MADLDNKYLFRILGAIGLMIAVTYYVTCKTAKEPAVEETEFLVSLPNRNPWFWRERGKNYPVSTDVYWCGAQNEDFGMSLTAARELSADPAQGFPMKRGLLGGY